MSRYKIDIVSQVDGRVVFDALVTDMPPREVLNALSNAALTVRRTNEPGHAGDAPLYRADDPARSIQRGARLRCASRHGHRSRPRVTDPRVASVGVSR